MRAKASLGGVATELGGRDFYALTSTHARADTAALGMGQGKGRPGGAHSTYSGPPSPHGHRRIQGCVGSEVAEDSG